MFIIQPPVTPEQEEATRQQIRELSEAVGRQAAAVRRWKAAHPPCPHCGHQEPVPPHITGLQVWPNTEGE